MRNQFGLILLAISIVIAAWIIAGGVRSTRPRSYPPDTGIMLKGSSPDPLSINLNNNPGNADYYTELTIGDNLKLYVLTGHQSAPIIIEGENIVAKYHHLARMLSVVYTRDSVKHLRYFADALEWGDKK